MTRRRLTHRNKRRQTHRGGFTGTAQPATYSDAQSYMLKTVGDQATQYNNTFQQSGTNNSEYPTESNAIRGLQGQVAGKRRRRKMKKSRGGFLGSVVNQAIVPLSLFGLHKSFSKKYNKRPNNKTFKK
jgi:hypothetical protein